MIALIRWWTKVDRLVAEASGSLRGGDDRPARAAADRETIVAGRRPCAASAP